MKTIVINALAARYGGGQIHLLNILKDIQNADFKVILLTGTYNYKVFAHLTNARIEIEILHFASKSIIHRCLWERWGLPRKLQKLKADVYYAALGVMTTPMPAGCRSVTMLRNMLAFDARERWRYPFFSYDRFKLRQLQRVYLKTYKMADKVIFISEYSRSEVRKWLPDIDSKSVVIPHGLDDNFHRRCKDEFSLEEYGLQKEQFYLYVSKPEFYKAQKETVLGWKLLVDQGFKYPLILVGFKPNRYGNEVMELIRENNLTDMVKYIDFIPNEKLPGMYQSARVLIFASSCECCPNIMLEKMSAGRPIICSNIQPMPEFGGEDVIYYDPYDPEMLKQQVLNIESEGSEKMNERGKSIEKRSRRYNWKQTAQKTFEYLLS